MTNRILTAVSVIGLAAAILAPSFRAEAQCRPDDLFCAELRIGPADPPPPPVIVQPPPPPVIVQPPPVIVQPPPPPVQPPIVIVRPQPVAPPPPQVIFVRPPPQPQPVVVQMQRRRVTTYSLVPAFDYGLHINLAGLMTENVGMGGVQMAFRLRPVEHIGIDIGAGLFGGESWNYGTRSGSGLVSPGVANGGERWEVPVTANVLFFFNPQHRFQVYALVGIGVSWAQQEIGRSTRELAYAGGEVGLGFEWRIGRHFALNVDARGFLRQHVGGSDERPEFQRVTSSGEVQSTDLSGGFYGTLGMTFYFGG
jgi:hypothetical protein